MGMKLLQFQTAIEAYKDAAYKDQPGWLDAMRRDAGHVLADRITRDASLYQRIDGDKDNPMSMTVHRWKIGVETDMDVIKAREAQMAEAKREGMLEAAAIVRRAADRFERVDGSCKWVIMESLRHAANEIERAEPALGQSGPAKEEGK